MCRRAAVSLGLGFVVFRLVAAISIAVTNSASKLALVERKFEHWIVEPLAAAGYEVHFSEHRVEEPSRYDLIWHGVQGPPLAGGHNGTLECAAYPVRDKLFVHMIISTALAQNMPKTCPLADGRWLPETHNLFGWPDVFKFKEKVAKDGSETEWILKIPHLDKGTGIEFMTHQKWIKLQPGVKYPPPWVLQRVVPNVLLTQGKVFEIRKLVFVSSYDPLVVYRLPKVFVKRGRTDFDPTRSETREVHITSMSPEEQKTYLEAQETSALAPGKLLDAWASEMSEEHGVNMSDLLKDWQTHAEIVTLLILSHLPPLKRGGSLVSADFLPTDDMDLQFLEINLFTGCAKACMGAVGDGIIAIQLETFRRQLEGISELGLGAEFTGPDMQLIHDDSQDPPFSLLDNDCRVGDLNQKWWRRAQRQFQ